MDLNIKWTDVEWVAFDTETSGKYPIDSEICEVAAVKYAGGKVVGNFQSLVAVSKPMSDEVIAIHHITNEMIKDAPTMNDVLPKFIDFIGDGFLIGHHSPFDMGFLAIDLERLGIPFPKNPVFCTSLLSRNLITDSPNHRLQTLIQHLKLQPREAHRALSDAEACLDVALACFHKMGGANNIHDLVQRQGRKLEWKEFSVQSLKTEKRFQALVEALENKIDVQIEYLGGTNAGQPRTILPIGIVLSPGQDFVVAQSPDGTQLKRFYLNKIKVSRF